eukprot:CAMPEP_0115657980 /NCGR_PEP_ID=MMETSP0272-20121206/44969_1 /TAXON_ID=71861 /ORGANISM="Scrippsiella trochoidea, Strain CCMP3099" /LENGTH=421 /DNA_ID=CAMNT_0003096043 /DNA_START=84 /DNA_END=1349 /DNA_ORIENTATION=-
MADPPANSDRNEMPNGNDEELTDEESLQVDLLQTETLERWRHLSRLGVAEHRLLAQSYSRRYFWRSAFPTMVMSAVAGMIVLVEDSAFEAFPHWLNKDIIVALMNTVTSVLIGCAAYWKWQSKAQKHQYATKEYGTILQQVESLYAKRDVEVRSDKRAKIFSDDAENITQKIEAVCREVGPASSKIRDQAEKQVDALYKERLRRMVQRREVEAQAQGQAAKFVVQRAISVHDQHQKWGQHLFSLKDDKKQSKGGHSSSQVDASSQVPDMSGSPSTPSTMAAALMDLSPALSSTMSGSWPTSGSSATTNLHMASLTEGEVSPKTEQAREAAEAADIGKAVEQPDGLPPGASRGLQEASSQEPAISKVPAQSAAAHGQSAAAYGASSVTSPSAAGTPSKTGRISKRGSASRSSSSNSRRTGLQ